MGLFDVVRIAGLVVLGAMLVRVFLMLIAARVRLTDVLGYVTAGAGLITVGVYAVEQFGVAGWAAIAGGLAVGAAWTARSIAARRRDPNHELLGVFVVSRPQQGIRNWVGRPAP